MNINIKLQKKEKNGKILKKNILLIYIIIFKSIKTKIKDQTNFTKKCEIYFFIFFSFNKMLNKILQM